MKKFLILGKESSGKTYTVKKIIKDVKKENDVVLYTSCLKESSSFDTFNSLLDSILEVDLFSKREQNKAITQAIELAGNVLLGPVSAFMGGKNEQNFSKDDIFIVVKNKFIDFLKRGQLIIAIDDVQWIDNASKELLLYLIKELSGCDNFILILSSKEEINSQISENANIISLSPLNIQEQEEFLSSLFPLSNEVIEWIINWFEGEEVYPSKLIDMIRTLYKSEFLIKDDNGIYSFSQNFDRINPDIFSSIKDELYEIINKYPRYQKYLEIASVMGKEFDINVLAETLSEDLIKIVKMLEKISKDTGLIESFLLKDNIYTFKSQKILNLIREILNYEPYPAFVPKMSQIFRIYNQKIAETMVKNNYKPTQIAYYYFLSGLSQSEKAIKWQLNASEMCKNIFDFKEAKLFLEKAKELSVYNNNKFNSQIEEMELILTADENFVYGTIDTNFTEKLLSYIDENKSDEIKIITARVCYDSGRENRDYFNKCYEVATKYLLNTDNFLTKAEGYHFAAISLDNSIENKEKKLEYFEKAMQLASSDKIILSKIANSYAGFLSFGTNEEKQKAKELFLLSKNIKENLPIKDLPGLARTYGGLGRLALFSNPCNCDEAIEYLNKDLQTSIDLKDNFGISNMYSLLGMAYRLKGDCKKANEYYDKSLEMKHNKIDIFASIFGKLACGSDEIEKAKELIQEYGNPPAFTYNFLDKSIKEKLNLE